MKEKKVAVGNKVTADATPSESEKSSASKKSHTSKISKASKITKGSLKEETPKTQEEKTPP